MQKRGCGKFRHCYNPRRDFGPCIGAQALSILFGPGPMLPSVCLFACVLAPAQPASSLDSLPGPRLSRGQELVYSGSYTEEGGGKGVQYGRTYRLENRLFVTEMSGQSMDVAILTILKPPASARGEPGIGPAPTSVRLELVRVDAQGRLTTHSKPAVPLDGPPTMECGAFVPWPKSRIIPGKVWEVAEDGRPPTTWQVVGRESANGSLCLKLEALQQSDDWERPRGDRSAWCRHETVWIIPALGVPARVERIIELRDAARNETSKRLVAHYDLESRVIYPGQLFSDREREIEQCRSFTQTVAPMLRNADAAGTAPWEAILARLTHHLENQPATPYREALFQLKRRIESAQRGETTAEPMREQTATPVATTDQPAPDFVTTDLATHESVRLKRLLGKPMLLLFYHPTSKTACDSLHFAQSLNEAHGKAICVLGLSVSEDAQQAIRQRKELGITFPILSGAGLRMTYNVDATPRWVVLDGNGVVRGCVAGWGQEIPALVREGLRQSLARAVGKPEEQGREERGK
jgi:peroxiredoxin